MIESLTPEQEKQMYVYRDKGLEVGNSTKPFNKEEATKAIKELYAFSDLEVPETFHYCKSPKEAQELIKKLTGEDEYVPISGYCTGSQETYWVYFYRYFNEQLGIQYDEKAQRGLEIMNRLCEHSGWFYLYDECGIICDKPEIIALDDNNEIHCEDGPAIRFRDGFEIYAMNGHVVPKYVITDPDQITVDDIKEEVNAETKRIKMEVFGVTDYLLEIGAEVLDADSLTLDGSAMRTLIKDDAGQKWLIGSDGSTKRVYHMAVPDEVNTCKEAHNQISGFDESRLIAEA